MKEDILAFLIQTEVEYHNTIKTAVKKAESYVDDSRKEQVAYIEGLKRDLLFFEKTEGEKLELMLSAEGDRMEEEAHRLKEEMKSRQEEKADQISSLLKEEVLSLLWR